MHGTNPFFLLRIVTEFITNKSSQASTLVACNKPEELGPLYTYITETSSGTALNYEAQKRVKARLSDLLMKEWTLVGIPVVVIAITALAKVEKGVKEEDVKVPEKRCVSFSFPYENWLVNELNRKKKKKKNTNTSAESPSILTVRFPSEELNSSKRCIRRIWLRSSPRGVPTDRISSGWKKRLSTVYSSLIMRYSRLSRRNWSASRRSCAGAGGRLRFGICAV